jgi:DNA replication and repair protein RecF
MITDLRLQHFRSYTDDSFELSPGVNIIVGPNAGGKTNLLEAILVLARGSSYRARDAELVQHDHPWARLDCHSDQGAERTVKIVVEPPANQLLTVPTKLPNVEKIASSQLQNQLNKSGKPLPNSPGKSDKSYELDGQTFQRLTVARSLPVVLFEPNHLRLFGFGPERRREYLDDLLEQTVVGYGTTRRQYRRALAQRNSLLKQTGSSKFGTGNGNARVGNRDSTTTQARLFPWDVRLSQLAGIIVRARNELVTGLQAGLTSLYQQLSGTPTVVTIAYNNRWPTDSYESQFLGTLATSQTDDQLRGFTGSGPHREDLTVLFDSRPAADTASRGEIRTLVLALKILELQILQAARDSQPPLLLLDDVFSELDGRRRHALTDYLAPYQTFITTTDADLVLQHFAAECQVIPLS